jgi:hypothetical protein
LHPSHVRDQPADKHMDLAGTGRPLQHRLARGQDAGDLTPSPRVGERERRHVGPGSHEQLDLVLADLVSPGPERQFVDLSG